MILHERRPAPPLDSYVERLCHWAGSPGPHRRERVLPNGRFQIIIDLSDGFVDELARHRSAAPPIVVGLQTQSSILETGAMGLLMGVVLRPGGTHGLFDVPADAFHNQVVPLDLIWGADACRLRDRLREAPSIGSRLACLEDALQRRAARRIALHPAVRHALDRFRHAPHIGRIADVRREIGLSHRRFSELFRQQVGLTPKLYCRVGRFKRVVAQAALGLPVDWADVALSCGYADQAHLAHEFREFSGMSPGTYLGSDRHHMHHVAIDEAAVY